CTQNAARHAIRTEQLKRVEMLPGADKLDRHSRDMLDRQQRAAPSIAVELGHDYAIQLERLIEGASTIDGVLPRHAVDDQEHLVGLHLAINPLKLRHQFGVDRQAAGGVKHDDIHLPLLRLFNGVSTNLDGIGFPWLEVDRHTNLFPE